MIDDYQLGALLFTIPIVPLVFKRLLKVLEYKHKIFGAYSELPIPFNHGWFYDSHKKNLSQIISSDTKIIVEIGSWYGESTIWMSEHLLAKNPSAKIYAIDLWDESVILNDNMYGNKVTEILKAHPLYQTFLSNLWKYRDCVIPLKMNSVDGLQYLKRIGIRPDIIYIDGNHHYEFVSNDILTCMKLFPDAVLVGDDYGNYEDVRRAVHESAMQYSKKVYVDSYLCWTFAELPDDETGVAFTPTSVTDFVSDAFSIPKERRSEIESNVASFVDSSAPVFVLPFLLSSFERKYVYSLATAKHLLLQSVGGGNDEKKYMVLWKNTSSP